MLIKLYTRSKKRQTNDETKLQRYQTDTNYHKFQINLIKLRLVSMNYDLKAIAANKQKNLKKSYWNINPFSRICMF